MPCVSICMNTFRHESFIRQAIEGVMMQQTTFPFQLVIGEDASDDNTRSVCEEMQQQYHEKILLLPGDQNHGQNRNLFRTLKACTGKYIALCEGDDYWIDPLKLEKQVAFLDNHPEYVMCFHPVRTVDKNGALLHEKPPNDQAILYAGGDLLHTFVPTPSLVFRNCLDSFPEAFFKVKSTDAFIVGMLSGFGKGADLGFIGGCYRKHDGGLYNRLSVLDKYKQAIHTRKMMVRSPYFNKMQKREIRRELARRETLYIKIFLKKKEVMNCLRIILFYFRF